MVGVTSLLGVDTHFVDLVGMVGQMLSDPVVLETIRTGLPLGHP